MKVVMLGVLLLGISKAGAQTQLSNTTPYTAQLVTVNGKIAWRYNGGGADQGLVTYDPGTKTQTNYHSDLRDLVNLTSYGDFAISRANDIGGGTGNGMMMTDGENFEILINYSNQGEANFYHNGIIYQIAKRDEIGTARGGNSARKLWAYNTLTGTGEQISDVKAEGFDLGNGNFKRKAPFGEKVLVGLTTSGYNHHLFTVDGTLANTTQVDDDIKTEDIAFMPISESLVLFFGQSISNDQGIELYKYDGTSVSIVEDLQTGTAGGGYSGEGFVMNGYAYFSGPNAVANDNLYRSNGTSIELVEDFSASGTSGASAIGRYAAVSDTKFVFRAQDVDSGDGNELWVSDGTSAGTFMLMDINTGTGGSNINAMTPIDGGAIFFATDGTEEGVYYTDGTEEGTKLISDLSLHNGVKALTAIGSRAYFADKSNNLFELSIPVTGTTTYTTSWDLGSPTAATNAIVEGDLTISTSLEVQNLEVASGASITVEAGATLTVIGDIFNEGAITVQSGGSLITNDGEYLIGNDVEILRNTSGSSLGYSFVGTPIEANASVTGASIGNPVYAYDETQAYSATGGDRWVDASATELVPGVGYAQAGQSMISFTGTPNNGSITVEGLTYSTGTASNQGWNLLSNPYPAAINAQDFIDANTALEGAIYLWDDKNNGTQGTNDDYLTVTSLGMIDQQGPNSSSEFDGYIGSMQGFFVKLQAEGTASVTFTEDMRSAGNNSDGNFFRKGGATELNIKLAISNNAGLYNELLVGLREDATEGVDRSYDASKLIGNPDFAFYSFIDDNKYAIQGLPASGGVSTELGFDLAASSTLTLSVVDMSGLDEGMTFILTDHVTGITYDLSEVDSFDFAAVQGTDQNRFTLTYAAAAILSSEVTANRPTYRYSNQTLTVDFASATDISAYAVYDFSGRLLSASDVQKRQVKSLQVPIQTSGIHIVRIVTTDGTFTRKFKF
ncbi:putative secreted protein (Por secretion system target) [Marinoscillum furvescens DSM 4134]|uniref:Putative secreted protein (Por secretion system target) n=2 Tax=Marinoscillum furvescens TaxID=1026 RepID=A0A3D9L6H4_MARFU|nr:putative secreted protein (Por secretion system target) [Marinoscillum furvescens DSM 4134]